MAPKRLRLHLTAIELNLERDPFMYSEAFGDEFHRTLDTRDYFRHEGGRALSAFVVLYPKLREAQIQWIEVGALPEGGEEDI
jgi:hypothetical protein